MSIIQTVRKQDATEPSEIQTSSDYRHSLYLSMTRVLKNVLYYSYTRCLYERGRTRHYFLGLVRYSRGRGTMSPGRGQLAPVRSLLESALHFGSRFDHQNLECQKSARSIPSVDGASHRLGMSKSKRLQVLFKGHSKMTSRGVQCDVTNPE